jgi:hypothetical protein
MATQKQFVDGAPAPVTPKTTEEKVKDLTPGQRGESEDQDYDENEHGDDIAAFKKETGLDKDVKPNKQNNKENK